MVENEIREFVREIREIKRMLKKGKEKLMKQGKTIEAEVTIVSVPIDNMEIVTDTIMWKLRQKMQEYDEIYISPSAAWMWTLEDDIWMAIVEEVDKIEDKEIGATSNDEYVATLYNKQGEEIGECEIFVDVEKIRKEEFRVTVKVKVNIR